MRVPRDNGGRRLLCALLALLLFSALLPGTASAEAGMIDQPRLENLLLSVDGGEARTVRTLHYTYDNNRYVSLRDMAAALSGTARQFEVSFSDGQFFMTTGRAYVPAGGEGIPFPENTGYSTRPIALNPMQIDGRELRYLTFLGLNSASRQDCFMSLTDLAMQLDLDVQVSAGLMRVDTAGGFRLDLETLREEGFFYEIHSALVGLADTGKIYAAWEPELQVPIASTTKLMTFLIAMDAASAGEITLTDPVVIPEEAARLSRTADAAIYLETGWETNVTELLCAMLLPSSNECALALAIHVAGSEAAFVERMNQKARALGLSDAVFYNCNGLPAFTDNLAATKIQNRMSASDMFLLVSHILRTYPEITQITSRRYMELPGLRTTVGNSNSLLFNVPGVVGLKTGSTNLSGACLVCLAQAADAEGQEHPLVAIEFGAEDSTARTTFTEELIRYGMQRLREDTAPAPPAELPANAEEFILTVLRATA